MRLSLSDVRAALVGTLPVGIPDPGGRIAAVAAVLRERDGQVEVLFIRRAKRRGDPWSGHMAWPGGKQEPGDADPVACAIRETREELGLDLAAHGELIGALRVVRGSGSAGWKTLRAVFPFVFVLDHPAELQPGSEVQEAVWIPLAYFTGWRTRRPWSPFARCLPAVPAAYRYHGRLIWGLTLWMFADLLGRLANAATHPTSV